MFGWLRRLFARDDGRMIFRYFDGERQRSADPVVLDQTIKNVCPDLDKIVLLMELPDPSLPGGVPESLWKHAVKDRDNAITKVASVVMQVFGVKCYNGETGKGLTIAERLALLADFQAFVGDLAEEFRPLASGSGLTDASPAPSADEPSAGSTSTATASATTDSPGSSASS